MKKHSVILKAAVALLLIATVLFSLTACSGAAVAESANGVVGNLNWSYDSSTKTLTITGTGDMENFENSDAVAWKAVRESATRVVVGEDVTSIGNYAFFGMTALTEVVLPKVDGAADPHVLTRIGNFAFAYSTALAGVSIPSSVTSVGDGAFEGCSSLTSIYLQENVTELGKRAFAYCYSLSSVMITGELTGVKDQTFKNCQALTSLVLRTSTTKEMIAANAFEGISSGFNFEKATLTDNATASTYVTVHYVFEDGSDAFPDFCWSWTFGTPYVIPSPTLEGYTPDLASVAGTIDGNSRTETVTYKKNAASAESVESETTAAPETSEKPSVATIVAVVIMALVLVAVGVGAFFLIRSDKKNAGKNTTTVRKSPEEKEKKKNKKSGK